MAMQGFKMVTRYAGRSRYVRFVPDEKLTQACADAGQDPRECWRILDHPPGNYVVTSLSHPGMAYVVRLDPESGRLLTHKCERLTNEPSAFCAHFVKAFLLWQEEQEQELDNGEWTEVDMNDSTVLATIEQPDMQLVPQPELPNREEWVALGRLAMQLYDNAKGSLVPNTVKSWQEVAGLMLYGRELGFDPMTSLKHVYMVNGRYELGSHGKRAMVQRVGGDIQYAYTEDSVTATLTRPGRPDTVVTYTIAQAQKTPEYGRNENWKSRPEDMLVAAATNRACRRGAADVINAIDWASRRVPTIHDMPSEAQEGVWDEHDQPQRALPDGGSEDGSLAEGADHSDMPDVKAAANAAEPDTMPAGSQAGGPSADEEGTAGPAPEAAAAPSSEPPPLPSVEDPRNLTYAEVDADRKTYFKALSTFQKAIRGKGPLPDNHAGMTLNAIVTKLGGEWPA